MTMLTSLSGSSTWGFVSRSCCNSLAAASIAASRRSSGLGKGKHLPTVRARTCLHEQRKARLLMRPIGRRALWRDHGVVDVLVAFDRRDDFLSSLNAAISKLEQVVMHVPAHFLCTHSHDPLLRPSIHAVSPLGVLGLHLTPSYDVIQCRT